MSLVRYLRPPRYTWDARDEFVCGPEHHLSSLSSGYTFATFASRVLAACSTSPVCRCCSHDIDGWRVHFGLEVLGIRAIQETCGLIGCSWLEGLESQDSSSHWASLSLWSRMALSPAGTLHKLGVPAFHTRVLEEAGMVFAALRASGVISWRG